MKKNNCLQRQIMKNIICAQVASDAAKGNYSLSLKDKELLNSLQLAGYATKDGYIFKAIQLIASTNNSGFNYYVSEGEDQNGYNSFIIYFDTKVDGKRVQISFHNFNKKLFLPLVGKGRRTHWDHQIGGSRKNCALLIKEAQL